MLSSLKIHRSKRRPPAAIVKPLEPYRGAQGWCRAGQETEEEAIARRAEK
jgi:hypothetical protein